MPRHEKNIVEFSSFIQRKKITFEDIYWTDECRIILVPKIDGQINQIRFNKEDSQNLSDSKIEKKKEQ